MLIYDYSLHFIADSNGGQSSRGCRSGGGMPPLTVASHATNQLGIGTSEDMEEDDEELAEEFTSKDALQKS